MVLKARVRVKNGRFKGTVGEVEAICDKTFCLVGGKWISLLDLEMLK
jgi:hypothetical protein